MTTIKDIIDPANLDQKAILYKTAFATIGCAHFSAGECVSVEHDWVDSNGVKWFTIRRSERGELPYGVAYPEHHLTRFCL